ncbi:MAG: hypothetical protein WCD12_11430 [Candidatus Binatus sp.]|uniref:hypothetical protein n=1 Tax=Candidatus Binatus sp. TaxID=2811406 RepID=UPI003C77EF38
MKKPLNHDELTRYVSLLADDVDDDHLLLTVLILALSYIDEAEGRKRFKNYLVGTLKAWQDLTNEADISVERKRVQRRALAQAITFAEGLAEFDSGPAPAWPAELPQQFRVVNASQELGPRLETRFLGVLSDEQWRTLVGSPINKRPFLWNGELLQMRSSRGTDGNDGTWRDVEVTVAIQPERDATAAAADVD